VFFAQGKKGTDLFNTRKPFHGNRDMPAEISKPGSEKHQRGQIMGLPPFFFSKNILHNS
jgi:hypothetical protein